MRWQRLFILNNGLHSWLSCDMSEDRTTLDEIEEVFMFPCIFHGLAPDLTRRVCDLYLVQLHARDLFPCSLFGYASEATLPL